METAKEVPSPAGPIHWSKDYVEHLRTVHFGLIGASAGLMLLLISAKPYNSRTALRQIDEIIELQKIWSPRWALGQVSGLRDAAAANSEAEAKEMRYPTAVEYPPNIDIDFGTDQQIPGVVHWFVQSRPFSRSVTFVVPKSVWFDINVFSEEPFLDYVHTPVQLDFQDKTLDGFQAWWNALHNTHTIYIPTSVSAVGGIDGDRTIITGQRDGKTSYALLSEIESGPSVKKAERLELNVGKPSDSKQFGLIGEVDKKKHVSVFFAFGNISVLMLDQKLFERQFRKWTPGMFDQSFSDLYLASRELDALELEDVRKFVSDEASKGTEMFEAFGMKIPVGQITVGGIAIVLSTQLYLFIYLKQLFGKLQPGDAGWDVPWLGMNQSTLARVVLFGTLILLPLAAVSMLAVNAAHLLVPNNQRNIGIGSSPAVWPLIGGACAIIVAAALGVSCWKFRPLTVKSPNQVVLPSDASKKE